MLEAEYVDKREVCLDACHPDNKCMNGGVCRNMFFDYNCDCLGTGFEGKYCERGKVIADIQIEIACGEGSRTVNYLSISGVFKGSPEDHGLKLRAFGSQEGTPH